jgi:integrase
MKTTFPKYPKTSLKPTYEKFKPKDKKAIENFLIFCGGTGGRTTINKYRAVITKICDVFEGDLDKIDLNRLREFLNILNQSDLLPATKNEVKKVLKRFLRETYDDWSAKFKQLKDIRGQAEVNQDKINADTILTSNEIESLIRGADSLKYKAMIITFYETGSRPEELINTKWKDIDLDKGSIKLKSSKTGNVRINPIQNSIIHLKQYKEQYPYTNISPDDWVFPSPQDRTKHQTITASGIYFKSLGKRILKRDIFLYLIRHTRATELQKVLPAKIYEKFMDHSIETATRYSHLNKEDVRDSMFKNVYKVNEILPEQKHILEKELEEIKGFVKVLLKLQGFTDDEINDFSPEETLENMK